MFPELPASVCFIERGWLNSNQTLLKSGRGHALIDSGYASHAGQTLAGLRRSDRLGDARLASLINTHCHSDHMGGNAALAQHYGCPISVPIGETALLEDWNQQALWLDWADQYCERFTWADTIAPGDVLILGDLEWKAIAAPGHDMGALMFYCEEHRLLISGDALWENGLGVVLPKRGENPSIDAAFDTLAVIRDLGVGTVIPGHGKPFADVSSAIDRAESKLRGFAADPVRTARHVMKVMLVFALLERGRLWLDDLAAQLMRVPCYRELNAEFVRLDATSLAESLLSDLKKALAVNVADGWILPTMAP